MIASYYTMAGLSTGLVLGLLTTLAFFWLGYSLNFSMIFGLIAAICGYCLGNWWHIDYPLNYSDKSPFEPLEKGVTQVLLKTKLIQPDTKISKRATRPLTFFEWILRQNKIPPKSKR